MERNCHGGRYFLSSICFYRGFPSLTSMSPLEREIRRFRGDLDETRGAPYSQLNFLLTENIVLLLLSGKDGPPF